MRISRRDWVMRAAAAGLGSAVISTHAQLAGSGMEGVPPMAAAAVPGRLAFNENPYGPPPAAREVIRKAADYGSRYSAPGGLPTLEDLRGAIAGRERVRSEQIVFGHGSWELLWRLAAVFGRDVSAVVAPDPTFDALPSAFRLSGTPVRALPVDPAGRIDLQAMADAAGGSRALIYVCNPNNPTGTVVPGGDLREFCTRMADRHLVVVDEAYFDYVDPTRRATMLDLVRGGTPLVVLRTFSKMYGMAGMRVGYAIAGRELADRLAAWSPGPLGVAGVAAARLALDDERFVEDCRQRNAKATAELTTRLRASSVAVFDSEANFVCARFGTRSSAFIKRVTDGGLTVMGNRARPEFVRISIGTQADMERLYEVVAAHSASRTNGGADR